MSTHTLAETGKHTAGKRLSVERPTTEPNSLIFLHVADASGGLGRSSYVLSQTEALGLADALRAAVAADQ